MKKIISILKANKILYRIYNTIGSFILKSIGLFIKLEDELLNNIINCDFKDQKKKTKKFKNKHIEVCDNTASYMKNIIKD